VIDNSAAIIAAALEELGGELERTSVQIRFSHKRSLNDFFD
jgi:hypothetical protein